MIASRGRRAGPLGGAKFGQIGHTSPGNSPWIPLAGHRRGYQPPAASWSSHLAVSREIWSRRGRRHGKRRGWPAAGRLPRSPPRYPTGATLVSPTAPVKTLGLLYPHLAGPPSRYLMRTTLFNCLLYLQADIHFCGHRPLCRRSLRGAVLFTKTRSGQPATAAHSHQHRPTANIRCPFRREALVWQR